MGSDLKILLRVLALFAPYRRWMLLGVLLSTITVLGSVGLMAIAGHFIAAMAIAGLAGVLMNYFLPAVGIRFLAILRTGGRYAERVASHDATFRLLAQLRVWLFRKLEPLGPGQLANERGADLAARIQNDVDTLQHAYLRLYVPLLTALACTTVVVAFFAWRSVAAAIVLFALMVTAGVIVPLIVRRASAAPGAAAVKAHAALRVALVDALQGMGDLAAYGANGLKAKEIAAIGDDLAAQQKRAGAFTVSAEGVVGLCAGLAMWLTALIAIAATGDGALGPAEVPMLALAALAAFEAVAPLPLAMQRSTEVVAAARRIFALADTAPAMPDPAGASPTPVDNGIVMRNVSLRHEGSARLALDAIDLALPEGRRMAVTGSSGAGKSSIARVWVRFSDYTGEVRFGGHDLRSYRAEDLRDRIAVLTQYTHLMTGTLRENLLLAAPEADHAAIADALDAAQLRDFVAAQPLGLDTPVGEGGLSLSAGQARRLAIARVLLRKAAVVVLDEPTEGLDPETARKVLQGVFYRMVGRSVLVITHDLTQVDEWVDEVVNMEEGRIFRRDESR
ncbi:thiol reductant ABC exporter subunit CydC [Variovorax sp. J22P168]|uniref:thiol reductant ABC exporter subunit CydC n=2 Tax=Variovorax jilinensis TaxID=3053513 RepID=UPI002578F498|nr:thiol reductant ABC exporter subunit CydC [Variovorax sp. J22P168]MDM0014630.1 thiol reductant ABC exporter subunit CydC [Variovorax sp. J22P168]